MDIKFAELHRLYTKYQFDYQEAARRVSLSQPSWNLVKAESDESGLKSSIMRTPV